MNKRTVVVTGLGAITPIGVTMTETWDAARNGVCGIAPIRRYDTSGQPVTLAAELKINIDTLLDKKDARRMDPYTKCGMVAAAEAMKDAALVPEKEDLTRCGVIVSSGIGGLSSIESECDRAHQRGDYGRISPYFIPMAISNMAAGQIAIRYGFKGMCSCIVTACASGSNAIGDAFRQIRDGYADVMLCGGCESCVTPVAINGFAAMKALHQGSDPTCASIPFDARRSGFVLGEGAGILVLEEKSHALARGAKIYAELAGYGVNCDAYHITAPAPDGAGGAACMCLAMQDAGVTAEQVQYINAHGTSTPMNDSCETAAIKSAFGEHAKNLMVSSTKSMTGHLLGAAGAVEAALTVLSLRDGFIAPTIGYQMPDPECDLDYVPNTGRSADIDCAISNSLGFGGHNVSLLFRKAVQP